MMEVHYYYNKPITFSKNFISAYELFLALSIPKPKRVFDRITRQASNIFRGTKIVRWQEANGEIKERIFLNIKQVLFCIHCLKDQGLMDDSSVLNFHLWYSDIVDRAYGRWEADGKEERIQDKLILLAGYGNIKLRQELTVLALPDAQEMTRRYDIVQFINRNNTVKIRELKSRKINLKDVEITLDEKGYKKIASLRWPNKRIEFIFSSLEGMDEEAQERINQINNVSYEDVRDLGLILYTNALKNTPKLGWNYFKLDVASKFSEVLPDQKLLRAAEDKLQKKMKDSR